MIEGLFFDLVHYWARIRQGWGHLVRLPPAQYVRAYVRGNKTDAGRLD
jgi:hypothetical protein